MNLLNINLLKQIKDIHNLSKGFSYCKSAIEINLKKVVQEIQERKGKIDNADKSFKQSDIKRTQDSVVK